MADPEAALAIAVASPAEPHRRFLLHAAARLEATRRGELGLAYTDPEHGAVHARALAELLAQVDGVDDPEAAARDEHLLDRLAADGWPDNVEPTSDMTREVLDTLRVMALLQERWGRQCCGRYIVSFSQSAADLVAVRALARLAVGTQPLRLDVVPLFETGDDLARSTQVLDGWVGLRTTWR